MAPNTGIKCPECGTELWWSKLLQAWVCPNTECIRNSQNGKGRPPNLIDELKKLDI